tara:strand:+ start:324 stop:788 length:465 start_codon:yes stop_codon:yes gene_type:complete
MFRSSIYYLTIILLLFGCTDSLANDENSSSTTGGSNLNFISIDFGSYTNNSADIIINTSEDISGFQFTIVGSTITEHYGGLSDQFGFSVSSNVDTGIILGYSLSGNIIPSGSNDVLITVTFENVTSDICLDNVVLSDPNANALDINFIGNCIEY